MAAIEAVEFLRNDHGDKVPPMGFRKTFAEDTPYKSLLQRNGMSLEALLQLFDWTPDDAAWCAEYDKPDSDMEKLIRYRRRVYFDIGGWRDIYEDFGRCDVSCLRDIRTPLVTSRSPLKALKDEFTE